MKPQLSILAFLISLSAFAQPFVRNQLDTNSPPRVTQDLFNSAALYTNSGSSVYYFWTNRLSGAWLGIVPGLGLVKSNAIAAVGSLLAGTNAAPNIGGMTSVGPGNGVFTNKVTIGSNQIAAATVSVQGNGTGLAVMVNTNQLVVTNSNVGVGTTSPIYRFVISSGGAMGLELDPTGAISAGKVGILAFDRNASTYKDISFFTSIADTMVIKGTGEVGIGTKVPATRFHVSGGGITLSNTIAATLPACILRTNMIGYFAVAASNPPTSGAGTAFIFAATNAAGTAEIFTMDGAGVVKQISEHAMDAPPSLIDDTDPFPNISKEWNDYLGQVRWINRSREAVVASGVIKLTANSYEAWLGIQAGANVALLANNNYWTTNRSNWAASAMGTNWYNTMKAFVLFNAAQEVVTMTETYDQYNTRLGLTNGSPGFLIAKTWTGVQNQILADYANAFTNAISNYNAAVSAGDTNAVAPIWSPPSPQPIPAWLYKRAVR